MISREPFRDPIEGSRSPYCRKLGGITLPQSRISELSKTDLTTDSRRFRTAKNRSFGTREKFARRSYDPKRKARPCYALGSSLPGIVSWTTIRLLPSCQEACSPRRDFTRGRSRRKFLCWTRCQTDDTQRRGEELHRRGAQR